MFLAAVGGLARLPELVLAPPSQPPGGGVWARLGDTGTEGPCGLTWLCGGDRDMAPSHLLGWKADQSWHPAEETCFCQRMDGTCLPPL